MFSRRILVSAVAVGAAAVAIVAGSVPAYALTTVTVTAGSAPSGTTVAFTATSGTISFKDLNTNFTGSCASSSLSGITRAGANSPSNVAQINGGAGAVIYNSCTTLGLPYSFTGVGTNVWTLAATGNTASGTTPITISGINLAVDSTSCSFNITGSAAGSIVNGNPSQLTISRTTATTSNLVVSNFKLKNSATKCLAGGITNTTPGNKISLSGTYNITATNTAYNPVMAVAS